MTQRPTVASLLELARGAISEICQGPSSAISNKSCGGSCASTKKYTSAALRDLSVSTNGQMLAVFDVGVGTFDANKKNLRRTSDVVTFGEASMRQLGSSAAGLRRTAAVLLKKLIC